MHVKCINAQEAGSRLEGCHQIAVMDLHPVSEAQDITIVEGRLFAIEDLGGETHEETIAASRGGHSVEPKVHAAIREVSWNCRREQGGLIHHHRARARRKQVAVQDLGCGGTQLRALGGEPDVDVIPLQALDQLTIEPEGGFSLGSIQSKGDDLLFSAEK